MSVHDAIYNMTPMSHCLYCLLESDIMFCVNTVRRFLNCNMSNRVDNVLYHILLHRLCIYVVIYQHL